MTDTTDIDIAAYWQYRMSQTSFDFTKPDTSLADFQALTANGPSAATLIARANANLVTYLATPIDFNVGTSSAQVIVLCDGTNSTRADLALLALYGQSQPDGTKTWIDNFGKTTSLTGTQLVSLATSAGDWISDCYGALADIVSQITAAKPTITTTAQVDSYTWPTS